MPCAYGCLFRDLIHQIERKKKYKKNIEAKKGQDQALQYQQNPSKKQELNQLLYEVRLLRLPMSLSK